MIDAGLSVVSVASRSEERASELAHQLRARAENLSQVDVHVDLVWLCVTDAVLPNMAEDLSRQGVEEASIFAHVAGAVPVSVLAPLQEAGTRIGKAHPIAALSGGAARCRDIVWGLEGADDVIGDLSEVVRALDGKPILLDGTDLQLYHLSAVFVANLVSGLLAAASELWERSGAPLTSEEALIPLLKTGVANWEELGLAKALTGPIARGDLDGVRSSLARLALEGDGFRDVYRALGEKMLALASNQKRLEGSVMAKMAQLLGVDEVLD